MRAEQQHNVVDRGQIAEGEARSDSHPHIIPPLQGVPPLVALSNGPRGLGFSVDQFAQMSVAKLIPLGLVPAIERIGKTVDSGQCHPCPLLAFSPEEDKETGPSLGKPVESSLCSEEKLWDGEWGSTGPGGLVQSAGTFDEQYGKNEQQEQSTHRDSIILTKKVLQSQRILQLGR